MSEASICAGASQIDLIPQDVPEWRKKWEKDFLIINGESAYYMNLNRNKKGITLNLKSEKGKDILRKLAAQSDILIENYRPSVMEKLGLGYEDMKEVNPGLIYGCVSGSGHYGPYSRRAGYDIIGQAMSGLIALPAGREDSLREPARRLPMCWEGFPAVCRNGKTGAAQGRKI